MASLNIVLEEGGIDNLSDQEKIELAERKNRYYLDMIDTIDESEVLPGFDVIVDGNMVTEPKPVA